MKKRNNKTKKGCDKTRHDTHQKVEGGAANKEDSIFRVDNSTIYLDKISKINYDIKELELELEKYNHYINLLEPYLINCRKGEIEKPSKKIISIVSKIIDEYNINQLTNKEFYELILEIYDDIREAVDDVVDDLEKSNQTLMKYQNKLKQAEQKEQQNQVYKQSGKLSTF